MRQGRPQCHSRQAGFLVDRPSRSDHRTSMHWWSRLTCAASALLIPLFVLNPAQPAEPVGKQISIIVAGTAGGGIDLYARMLARHIGRHIPGNPAVVPKNMEGAASMRLANWLANVAPKDGTVFGTIGRGT